MIVFLQRAFRLHWLAAKHTNVSYSCFILTGNSRKHLFVLINADFLKHASTVEPCSGLGLLREEQSIAYPFAGRPLHWCSKTIPVRKIWRRPSLQTSTSYHGCDVDTLFSDDTCSSMHRRPAKAWRSDVSDKTVRNWNHRWLARRWTFIICTLKLRNKKACRLDWINWPKWSQAKWTQ